MATEHLFLLIFEFLKFDRFPLIKTLTFFLMFSMDCDMLLHSCEKATHSLMTSFCLEQ